MILCVDHYHVYSELDQMSPYDQIFVKKSLSASEGALQINCLSSLHMGGIKMSLLTLRMEGAPVYQVLRRVSRPISW